MDAVIVLMIFQTIVFMTTLLVLAFQARQQVKALRFDAYARCQADYSALIRMLAENRSLHSIYDTMVEASPGRWKWEKYNPKEKQLYNFLELNLELLERVYVLRLERWIDEETWQHWDVWLQDLASVPLLGDVWRDNAAIEDVNRLAFGQDAESGRRTHPYCGCRSKSTCCTASRRATSLRRAFRRLRAYNMIRNVLHVATPVRCLSPCH